MHPQTTSIQVSHCFIYPCQVVFDCWLQESATGRWLLTPQDEIVTEVMLDPRVGGRFQIRQQRDSGGLLLTGQLHLMEPPHQLLFSLDNASNTEPDLVRLQFCPHPFGCELTIFHHLSADSVYEASSLVERWTHILMRLAADLNEHRTNPKRILQTERVLEGSQ